MRRLLALSLLLGTIAGSLAALAPVPRGIYHGTWTVTNARTDVVTSGPLSVVYRDTGKPMVHLWLVNETEGGTNYTEYFKAASRPTRRSIACTIPRFVRLSGQHSPDNEVLRRITGRLRFKEFGSGTFTVTRVNCGIHELGSGIPLQLVLRDIYQIPCELEARPINPTNIVIRPPQLPVFNTNFPPYIPRPIEYIPATNHYGLTGRVDVAHSNIQPAIIRPPVVIGWHLTNPPPIYTNVLVVRTGLPPNVVLWLPGNSPAYTNQLYIPSPDGNDAVVIRAWLNAQPMVLPRAEVFVPIRP